VISGSFKAFAAENEPKKTNFFKNVTANLAYK